MPSAVPVNLPYTVYCLYCLLFICSGADFEGQHITAVTLKHVICRLLRYEMPSERWQAKGRLWEISGETSTTARRERAGTCFTSGIELISTRTGTVRHNEHGNTAMAGMSEYLGVQTQNSRGSTILGRMCECIAAAFHNARLHTSWGCLAPEPNRKCSDASVF